MGRMKRRRKRKAVIILFEIICLIVLGFGAYKVFDNRAEEQKQRAAKEEAAKQAEMRDRKTEKRRVT